ncbi:MAG: hypothetical protein ACKO4T_00570 [Planctomycetaceae bacterium]
MSGPHPDDAAMLERLGNEAACGRPDFNADLHERILAAVRRREAGGARGRSFRGRRFIAAAVCLGLGFVAAGWRADREPRLLDRGREVVETAGSAPADVGIDSLPTFDEFGADVVGGIGSLAATVVGLPEWRDLAVADLPVLDAWRPGVDEWLADRGPSLPPQDAATE